MALGRHVLCYSSVIRHIIWFDTISSSNVSRGDIAGYPDFTTVNTLLVYRAVWHLATRCAIPDDQPQPPATKFAIMCCNCRPLIPHGKRKHEMQCHCAVADWQTGHSRLLPRWYLGDVRTDNRQGPKAWVDLHEPPTAGNPESFNVHRVATNRRNGASEAPGPGCCVRSSIRYSPGLRGG